MPWQESNKVDLRKDFVMKAMEPGSNISGLCRDFNISRQQGYKWLRRYKEKGVAGLEDASRARRKQALATSGDIVLETIEWKQKKPRWGPQKIHAKLVAAHDDPPSIRTVARILTRAGLVKKVRKRVKLNAQPTEAPVSSAEEPNDLWTVDFKGWWLTGDNNRCEPLTIRDQASRFVFAVQILPSTTAAYVREVFEELFKKYGLPKAILSDNGSPFGCTRALRGLTRLSAWFVSLGIEVRFSRPGCPQDNGAHERMHFDIRYDLEDDPADTLDSQQAACDAWRHEFNNVRPHSALGMKTPNKVYKKSRQRFQTRLFATNSPVSLRRVITHGGFWWKGTCIKLGRAFVGFDIGVEPLENGQCRVWFFDQDLGCFDLADEDIRVRFVARKSEESELVETSEKEAA